MNYLKIYAPLALSSVFILTVDQWTKWWARTTIPFAGRWLPEGWEAVEPYFRFVHWYNTGAAFGMFQGQGWIFAGLAVIVALVILYYYPHVTQEDWWLKLALILQFNGAVGNLIDRVTLDGKVTDFLSFGTFPVFNVADACISVGVAILVLGTFIKERAEAKAAAQQPSAVEEAPQA